MLSIETRAKAFRAGNVKSQKYWLRGIILGVTISIILDLWLMAQPSCVGLAENGYSPCPKGFGIILTNLKNDYVVYLSILFSVSLVALFIGWSIKKIKTRHSST
ncbi:MAG: hypothetical protein A3H57_02500 [Candidatus Taylorbacteria bacterium RIFCSPLOWO2_02_FULL_43_11]|uniref:Uncharacterized protein n=1 Tax=Candidatus Taylorbacteria bacterium RIFCSPHIGHO2_02_FULL_43_32b TaxID=1802306 RepID=A0A1G2MFY7_9BACT|nr:MAG: hypothetical protein A2743_00255 [Candidatus Taylorbacteria bacterium RIFCSPHIGHO2_01_FULL_43_47]OHA22798.1 MAG: hypothetical protein A3C72_02695 [Candidatus Taylorbacteria bacterium RIFCSPHIGHO2_02_FULL_43_32b]OHA30854.1 MAG: hypothetical protein A3B08_01510 [Candidatus Taylorbacteria bacterium RIFCSPLOWO2_01_FULL_43_44]OHA35249.1 MAG: hypothetical protein A3H57_02500 [Candidatus Taylorbacteria bacterium RIFCSPLOWO2_02_FULL_43_11]